MTSDRRQGYAHQWRQPDLGGIARDPDRASVRAKSDAELCIKINVAYEDNRKLYGARKIWHVLLRDKQDVARCTVERLMRRLGLKGVLRGRRPRVPERHPAPIDVILPEMYRNYFR